MRNFIFAIIFIGVFFIYNTLLWGWVLYNFWNWFVLPVFTTLPEVTFIQALGLMFVIGLFKSGSLEKPKEENLNYSTAFLFLSPWITFVFGWLAYSIWII